MYLYPGFGEQLEKYVFAYVADEDAEIYRPTDILNMSLDDIYDVQIAARRINRGIYLFQAAKNHGGGKDHAKNSHSSKQQKKRELSA